MWIGSRQQHWAARISRCHALSNSPPTSIAELDALVPDAAVQWNITDAEPVLGGLARHAPLEKGAAVAQLLHSVLLQVE